MREALYYQKQQSKIKCILCPHYCELEEGQVAKCQIRIVKDNRLIASSYGQVSAIAVDPIEKKPLFHFYPGKEILSLGTIGCNLKCSFCQNYQIAHDINAQTRKLTSKEAVDLALAHDSIGIAYTYSEPLIWYKYILETARLAQQAGLKNVLVSNGIINQDPMQELLPYLDAINLDVKAFSQEFYQEICQGKLEPVKRTVELVYDKVLLEITTLLIPGLNDSPQEIKALVEWIASLNPNIPLHFCRYFPQYQMDLPPTNLESLFRAKTIAEERLNYVYLGNIDDSKYRSTYCPDCKREVITRDYGKASVNLEGKQCPNCGREISIRR